jgi:hypothetical protein
MAKTTQNTWASISPGYSASRKKPGSHSYFSFQAHEKPENDILLMCKFRGVDLRSNGWRGNHQAQLIDHLLVVYTNNNQLYKYAVYDDF